VDACRRHQAAIFSDRRIRYVAVFGQLSVKATCSTVRQRTMCCSVTHIEFGAGHSAGPHNVGWRLPRRSPDLLCGAAVRSGPSRHVALRWPSVANGALRTRLDLQLAPPGRDRHAATTKSAHSKRACSGPGQRDHHVVTGYRLLIQIVALYRIQTSSRTAQTVAAGRSPFQRRARRRRCPQFSSRQFSLRSCMCRKHPI
jgi:hypothetical protein